MSVPGIENKAEAQARRERRCEQIECRIDIAANAYIWAQGVYRHPWTFGLTPEGRRLVRDRVRQLSIVANGHGVVDVKDASDEAALRVLQALSLKGIP